jgi:6-phosphogluconolactonase
MRTRSFRTLTQLLAVSSLFLALAACGSSGTNNTNMTNNQCSGCTFLYASTNAGEILTYRISSSVPFESLSSIPAPNTPYFGELSPSGPVYAIDANSNALDAFVVNYSNGSLSPLSGSPFSLGSSTGSSAGFTSIDGFFYVGNTNGTISGFDTTGTGGITTPVPGSPYPAGVAPLNLIWNNSNLLVLYAADFSNDAIWAYTVGINQNDGSLTAIPGSPFATPPNSAPAGMAAVGNTLYVALSGTNQIAAYSIGSSGALTTVPGSPFAAGGGPESLLSFVAFNGSYLYALNGLDHTISAYSMNLNTGVLTEVPGSPFQAGAASGGMIIAAASLYVPDLQSSAILAFDVNANGSLTPSAGSPFPTSAGPVALTVVDTPILDPPAP